MQPITHRCLALCHTTLSPMWNPNAMPLLRAHFKHSNCGKLETATERNALAHLNTARTKWTIEVKYWTVLYDAAPRETMCMGKSLIPYAYRKYHSYLLSPSSFSPYIPHLSRMMAQNTSITSAHLCVEGGGAPAGRSHSTLVDAWI